MKEIKKRYQINNVQNINVIRKIEIVLQPLLQNNLKVNKDTNIMTIQYLEHQSQEDIYNQVLTKLKDIDDDLELEELASGSIIRKSVYLKNLDCANCAAKIERIAKRTFDHESITVDFSTTKFIIETYDQILINNLIKEVEKITQMVDDNIIVVETLNNNDSKEEEYLNKEKNNRIKFCIGLGIFLVGFITKTVVHIITGTSQNTNQPWLSIIIYMTYIPAYLFLGADVLYSAIKNIKNGRIFDEKFLMSLATVTALLINYYDEAIFVMIFYKIGELCQQHAVNYSRKSIKSILDIQAQYANVLIENEVKMINVDDVVIGDILIVKEGERFPLDGVVIDGEAHVDNSALTGESMQILVKKDDVVLSGSINVKGNIKMKVNKLYNESMASKVLNLVENASAKKSKSENFISKFAKYYTPIVVVLALLIAISLPFISSKYTLSWVGGFQESIKNALVFLVVSCPCALVISIPLGFFGGIGGASRQGILIKGSNYLEALNYINTVVFDKTGTLTKGQFKVSKVIVKNDYDEREALRYTAYVESLSNHPIAKSIIDYYGNEIIDNRSIKSLNNDNNNGVKAIIDNHEVLVGNLIFMKDNNIEVDIVENAIYTAIDNKLALILLLEDEIKEEVKKTINELKNLGVRNIVMITGDNYKNANEVAKKLSIDQVYANVNPIEKVQIFETIKSNNPKNKTMFVGDGINDAPVLSSADIGVAMGAMGSDAAIEVADIVLMSDDLLKIPYMIKVAKKTKKIIIENILLALVVKLLVLIIAPLNIVNYLIIEAIFADVGVSLIAIINSLRAMKKIN